MISRGFLAVLKMHIKQQLLSKAFVLSTILMPLIMFGVIAMQVKLTTLNNAEKSHLFVTSDDQSLLDAMQKRLSERKEVKDGIYRIDYQLVEQEAFESYVASKRPEILANSNNGLFFVPGSALDTKEVRFYSTNIGNQILRQAMADSINFVLNQTHFGSLNVAQSDIDFAVKGIDYKGFNVKQSGEEQGSAGNTAVGLGLSILLVISMMGIVMPFQAAILEEKSNRAVEVLLTSVRPHELLAGKIVARTITGLAQMLIWLIPLFLFLTIFLSVWGGFSAMFDSAQDAGQAMWPVTVLMWVPFYAVFAVLRNPANSVAEILSIAPFTSLYVMPVRLAVLEVPAWQPLVALLLNGIICWLCIRAGGKIYRISVLSTGQPPSMRQFIGWLRSE